MRLPNELVLKVLGYLEKPDLKTVRHVCKTWNHYASEPLFKRLYISPREEDIKVFEAVTQHPQLRKCVRELEYDTTSFSSRVSAYRFYILLRAQIYVYRDQLPKLRALHGAHSDP